MKHLSSIRFLMILFLMGMIACKEDKVTPSPLAAFSISNASAEVNEAITFNNTSQHASSYLWDFGDGNTSTIKSPTHAYAIAGTFTVVLTASGEGGSHSANKTVSTSFPVPVAAFTSDKTTAEVGESISFNNSSQHANTYSWEFGDGNTSTDENPIYAYSTAGTYTIKLTVEGDGGMDVATQMIEITAPPFLGRWNLQTGSYNGNMINNLTGYFDFVDESKYKAKFDDGSNSGTIFTAGYVIAESTFKTNINGNSLALNGISSEFTCCPNETLWQASMACSRLVFNQWAKTAIGFGEPTVEIISEQLIITSADGKTTLTYSK